jgi:hypothetical protein
MDLQEQIDTGKQAEDFLRYLSDHPYFEGLLERVRLELARQILDLVPQQKDAFSEKMSQMNGVGMVLDAVRGDIYLAAEAFKQLNGLVDETKGIL